MNRWIDFASALRARLPLSREGLWWLVLASAMLATGLVKSINLISFLACILVAAIFVNLILAWRQLRGVSLARELPDCVSAGSPDGWRIRLSATSGSACRGLHVTDNGLSTPVRWCVDLARNETPNFECGVEPTRRGVFALGELSVESGFPLGLANFKKTFGGSDLLHVGPRLGSVRRGALRRRLARSSPSIGTARGFAVRHPSAQTEFHGLRMFRPGDSPRWIHWKTSARRGELMVREFEEFPNDDLVLIVDPSSESSASFERMLSVAASICHEWCRQKGDRLTLLIPCVAPIRVAGPTGRSLLVEIMRVFAGLTPSDPDLAKFAEHLGEFPTPRAAHLVLSVGPSRLIEALNHASAECDIAAGDDAEFFDDL